MRKLNEEQIMQLFAFVKSKYVRYIDVQCELVDHLACAIEEIWETSPQTDFNIALNTAYNRFPITGFSSFVKKQEAYLSKYWMNQLFQGYKKLLFSPYILIPILIYFFFNKKILTEGGNYLILGLICIYGFVLKPLILKNAFQTEGKYLFYETFYRYSKMFILILTPFFVSDLNSTSGVLLFTLICTHFIVLKMYVFPLLQSKLDKYKFLVH